MDLAVDDSVVKTMRDATSKFDVTYWRHVCDEHVFPSEYWRALQQSGLLGILVGKEWGGMGRGMVEAAIATEETAEHHAGLGSYLFLSGALAPLIFAMNAGDEMKKRLLPSLVAGRKRVSIALTEEESGLDSLSLKTTARRSSGGYVIDGSKTFVTNVDIADFLLLFARTKPAEEGRRAGGISMFLVEAGSRGIRAEKLEKLGMDFNTLSSLEIENLKVGPEDLVGMVDEAWNPMKAIFERDRILTAASLVGTGKLALSLGSAYVKSRTVFGRAVGSNQGIQFPMADAWAQLLAAETMALKAASIVQKGRGSTEANVAFLEAVTASAAATDRSLQAFGGHGYLKKHDVERYWRDVRVHRVHPVSEELLLASIAHKSLDLPSSY